MSALRLTPVLSSYWDELVAELPYGLVLHEGAVVVAANRSAADLLGLSDVDLRTGARPSGWRVLDDAGAALPDMADIAAQRDRAGTPTTVAFVVTAPGGPTRRLYADLHPFTHRRRALLLVVLRPVVAEPARAVGLVDHTTGLPLRALLFDRIEQALARARVNGTRVTLVLADLRGLGAINARWGFARGDDVLAGIGARLRTGLREDHTVARYTGGTFAVLSEHPQRTDVVERVHEITSVPVPIGTAVLRPRFRFAHTTSDGGHTLHAMVEQTERGLR